MKKIILCFMFFCSVLLISCGGGPSNEDINKYSYANISNGMTMEQVTELLGGSEGKQFTTSATDTTYRWWDGAGYTVYVTFENGVVTRKKDADINESN